MSLNMPQLLDCTLRDGGYVNNWEFDEKTANAVIDGLYDSGVRWIEIGIMGKGARSGEQTKFSEFDSMIPLLENRRTDCHYALMLTTASSDNFVYPQCTSKTPDVIRIAFFKPELDKTLKLAYSLKEKGYIIFLQPMATFMYDDDELKDLVDKINTLQPYAMYMVDSFSTMYPKDVEKMRDTILGELDRKISFGFHAHNNIQMAYANVQKFLEKSGERVLFADGSIYGMGRGAGNVPTELLMKYLNDNFGCGYDISVVLGLYEKYLHTVYKEYGWGYTMPYCVTAMKGVNSAWGWYFMSKGIDNIADFEKAVGLIPAEWTYTLKADIADKIIDSVKR